MQRTTFFTLPGLIAGLVIVLGLGGGILLGSRSLRNDDPTLLIYTCGAMFLACAITYRLLQRPLHLGVTLHKQANTTAPPAVCHLCGADFTGAMHVEDLNGALAEVGLDWRLRDPVTYDIHVCSRCRRRQVGIWHAQAMVPAAPHTPDDAQVHHDLLRAQATGGSYPW